MVRKITSDEPHQLAFSDFDFDDLTGTVVPKTQIPAKKPPARLQPKRLKKPAGIVSVVEQIQPKSNPSSQTLQQQDTPVTQPQAISLHNQLFTDKVYSVGEFLETINLLLAPIHITIQGEINSVTERGSAVYFTLSDPKEKATLHCIVWKNKMRSFGFELREGLEVKVVGTPNIYKPFGKFSFTADYISPVGEGALKQALEQLKKQLEADGYFASERKRPIPPYIQSIGLITSEHGDAKKDFLTHVGNHGISVRFFDVRVEGAQSIPSIVQAIRWFNEQMPDTEVLVLTRGGGSLESLQSFNSLEVARAIFSSRIPVLSAVGHENDVSIADLVADMRASTPTHAGKILGTPWEQAAEKIDTIQNDMFYSFRQTANKLNLKLQSVQQQVLYAFEQRLRDTRQFIDSVGHILQLADPKHLMKQGYSLLYTQNGKLITSVSAVSAQDTIEVQLYDGLLESIITTIKPYEKK